MAVHFVIPDLQVRSNKLSPCPLDHLSWIGKYMVSLKPDTVIQLGDWQDFDALGQWSKGTLSHEGKKLKDDLDQFDKSMKLLMDPLKRLQKRTSDKYSKRHKHYYSPRLVALDGNHEHRLDRFVQSNPEFEGFIDLSCLKREENGWEVVPFLKPIEVDGILYCHYFPRSANGKVMQTKRGAPNARTQVQREMQSCTSGHLQGLDTYVHQLGNRRLYGLIAGSCYLHLDDYMSPQGTKFWHGVIIKHEVREGQYDLMLVSLDYLCRKYEQMPLDKFLIEKYGAHYE